MPKRVFIYIAVVVIGGVLALWLWTRPRPIEVIDIPLPPDLVLAEPTVRSLIEEAAARVSAAPRNPETWYDLALVYQANERFGLARLCHEQTIALHGDHPHGWYHLAICREQTGDYNGALEAMDRVIELEPGYAPAHWRRGLWRLAESRLDEAEQAFRKANELDPQHTAGWLGLARVHLQRNENEEAAAVLEQLLEWAKANVGYGWSLLGTAYRRLGREAEAETALERGRGAVAQWNDEWQLDVFPYRVDVTWQLDRAMAMAQGGQVNEAVALLRALHEAQPRNAEIPVRMGRLSTALGQHDAAIAAYQLALSIDGQRADAHFNLALLRWQRSAHDDAAAESTLAGIDRALQINPAIAQAHALRGAVLRKVGRREEALAAYETAQQYNPANPVWSQRIAEIRAELGDDAPTPTNR